MVRVVGNIDGGSTVVEFVPPSRQAAVSSLNSTSRNVLQRLPLVSIRVRVLLGSLLFLLPHQLSTHAYQRSTTETPREHYFVTKCGHRGVESCEGALQHHAGQARVCLLQRYPHDDQSRFLSASSAVIGWRLKLYIQESMTNEEDCVEIGMACADVCTALSRGLNEKSLRDLNNSVCAAIERLTT